MVSKHLQSYRFVWLFLFLLPSAVAEVQDTHWIERSPDTRVGEFKGPDDKKYYWQFREKELTCEILDAGKKFITEIRNPVTNSSHDCMERANNYLKWADLQLNNEVVTFKSKDLGGKCVKKIWCKEARVEGHKARGACLLVPSAGERFQVEVLGNKTVTLEEESEEELRDSLYLSEAKDLDKRIAEKKMTDGKKPVSKDDHSESAEKYRKLLKERVEMAWLYARSREFAKEMQASLAAYLRKNHACELRSVLQPKGALTGLTESKYSLGEDIYADEPEKPRAKVAAPEPVENTGDWRRF